MNKGCLISLAALVLLATVALGAYFSQKSDKAEEGIELTKATIGDITKKAVANGSVKPRKEVSIKPQVSGVVEELFVQAGETVKKGQKIARIKLVPSEVNINNAQSGVDLARIRYKEALRELERQKNVNTKQLDTENARVNFENAKTEEARQRKLFEDGVISDQDYNRFKVDFNLRKAEFDNQQILSGNTLRQFEAEVDIRKAELDAAISNLQLLKEGATKNSSQVSNVVTSTVDGMVLDVPIEEGSSVIERNNFNEGTTIASIADMNSLIFEGMVDESDVGKLKEGMPLELTIGAIEKEKFAATLEYISPKGVTEEGTVKFEVRAAIKPSSDIFLRAGYSASADIILNERDIIMRNDSTFVKVKTGDNQFEERAIETGLSDGILIEVLSGLDTVVQVQVLK
jgi:HlyD family secretion protein